MSNLSGRVSGNSTINAHTMSPTKGTGIASMEQTVVGVGSDAVNTWQANLTDGTSYSFNVKNGSQGETGPQGVKGDTGAGVPAGGTAGQVLVKKSATDHDTEWSGELVKDVSDLKTAIETKANIDGNYKDLTAGSADQLVSTQYHEDQEPYLYRTSGGSADIGDLENDVIVGGSVVWNQILPNDIKSGSTSWASDTTTYYRSIVNNVSATLRSNHKYFLSAYISRSISGNNHISLAIGVSGDTISLRLQNGSPDGYVQVIGNVGSDHDTIFVQANNYSGKKGYSAGDTVSYDNLFCIDLTTMFGTAIADYVYSLEQTTEGSGIAWLRKYGFFTKDYYEYSEPTIRSVEGLVSHDMVGFNQWDEEWEAGDIYNGEPRVIANTIRSKNFTRCVPNTQYHLYCGSRTATSQYAVRVVFYDLNKNYISVSAWCANLDFTTPSNCGYFKITTQNTRNAPSTYGGTYNNDICVNFSWSGTRNGEYEPYEKASYPLDSSLTLRGIPKLDSQNQLYYDGDTYESDGTVTRRYGIVNLGTLTWSKYTQSDESWYFYNVFNAKKPYGASRIQPFVCAEYRPIYDGRSYDDTPDRTVYNTYGNGNRICVKDSRYTDVTTFKAAVSGVYLVYELATETTETASPFVDPQRVNDWGTEEYVCQFDSDFIVPVGHDTKYRVNLRDKLQHLPDMADNDGYYLIQQAGSKMSLVNFRIPQAPQSDGTYILKATVSGGVPTYTWEAVVESTATEG